MARYTGFKDKNEKRIHDEAILSRNLNDLDLENARSNWERLLKEAKNQGAKKVIIELESQDPYFVLKYKIRFDKEDIKVEDHGFSSIETLYDSFFLSYISKELIIENEIKDDNLTFLDWTKSYPYNLKYKGKDVLLEKEYIIENISKEFSLKNHIDKELDMRIFLTKKDSFHVNPIIKFMKKDGSVLLNRDTIEDLPDEETDSDKRFLDREYEVFVPPHGDHMYQLLKNIFNKHS